MRTEEGPSAKDILEVEDGDEVDNTQFRDLRMVSYTCLVLI